MTIQEEQGFKKLIIEALSSNDGQGAIIKALKSPHGQAAIKQGVLEAIKSKEGKEVFGENFVEVYKEFVEPAIEDMWDDIRQVKTEVRHMKEKDDIRFQRLERKVGIAS